MKIKHNLNSKIHKKREQHNMKVILDIHSKHRSKSTDMYSKLLDEITKNKPISLVRLNNFISNESQSNDNLISFKSHGCKLNLKKINLNEIKSLKDKTRLMRRQASYNSMSEEPILRFNESKESKLY